MAQQQGAETIDFEREGPVEVIMQLTGGIGVHRAIDAVGVDSEHAHHGPAASVLTRAGVTLEAAASSLTSSHRHSWTPGDDSNQAMRWAVDALAKAGTLSIVGVYPPEASSFPIGRAMNKNLTVKMGNCHHRKYIPHLLDFIASNVIDPTKILSRIEPMRNAIQAYEAFDSRTPGWIKVELRPAA